MEKIQIKHESLPERCDICHQADLFDAQTNVCSRCNTLRPINQPPLQLDLKDQYQIYNRGIWQDHNVLVVHKNAQLPNRCIKCNKPVENMIRRKLSWFSPYVYLLLLLNILAFLIGMLITTKRAQLHIGVCQEHVNKRGKAVAISWVTMAASILLMLTVKMDFAFFWLGFPLFFIGVAYGIFAGRFVEVKKIDDHYVYLKNVDQDYLSQFPQWPSR